jgi:hypothetical protein
VVQDDDRGIILQSTIQGHVFQVDPQVNSSILDVSVLHISANPFNGVLEPPTFDKLRDFFHTQIRIGAFSPPHCLPTKIVQHNLWPIVCRSELILKRAQFLYAIVMRMPFCLCKHVLNRMLEMRDDHSIGLPFACLVTKIILKSELDISAEPKMKV